MIDFHVAHEFSFTSLFRGGVFLVFWWVPPLLRVEMIDAHLSFRRKAAQIVNRGILFPNRMSLVCLHFCLILLELTRLQAFLRPRVQVVLIPLVVFADDMHRSVKRALPKALDNVHLRAMLLISDAQWLF